LLGKVSISTRDETLVHEILQKAVKPVTRKGYNRDLVWLNTFLETHHLDVSKYQSLEPWENQGKTQYLILYMDYLKNHPLQPNIDKCMTALSDHLRSGIIDHSIIDNWSVRGAKIAILRTPGRELSLNREKLRSGQPHTSSRNSSAAPTCHPR
jgi:hypothetical protein